jgi:hypothetical protein
MTSSVNDSGLAPLPARKAYEKPRVVRIVLDARCAVLGFCKSASAGGPVMSGCQDAFGDPCSGPGS